MDRIITITRDQYYRATDNDLRAITAHNDAEYGRRDRMAGYYDKWYRYNHSDDGAAYDAGVRMALQSDGCPEDYQIIETAQ